MNYILVGIIVSLILTGIFYLTTQNILLALLVFLISIVFFVLVVHRKAKKNQLKIHRYHQCFQFINSFIISLNVKGSMSAAIESGYETTDDDTKAIIDSIKELNEEEKIMYLCKYFKFDLYRLFVDTINLWNEEGGDILKMSQYLINQVRLKEQYLITCETIHRQKTTEFIVLWSISLAILAILRFALSTFFDRIRVTIFYQVAVTVIVLFVLVSVYILLLKISKLDLEGWKDNEK